MKLTGSNLSKYFKIALAIILFCTVIIKWSGDYFDKAQIKMNYSISKGKIVNYYKIGDIGTPYLKYEYKVDENYYLRSVIPKRRKDSCYTDFSLCKDRYYWVIYSRSHPYKSLINLDFSTTKDDTCFPTEMINEFY